MYSHSSKNNKWKDRLKSLGTEGCFALLLVLLLLFVTGIHIFSPDKAFSETEKRVLAQWPSFSVSSLKEGRFMQSVEEYVTDQFPARDLWMRLKTRISFALGQRLSNDVYYMKDNTLAERFPEWDESLASKTLSAVNDFAGRHEDIPFYFLLAPTRIGIYEDMLPSQAVTGSQNAYMDWLYASLGSSFQTIDIRDSLSNARRAGDEIYYASDHHWTSQGAYLAYQQAKVALGLQDQSFRAYTVMNQFCGSLMAKSGFSLPDYDAISLYMSAQEPHYYVLRTESNESFSSCYDMEKLSSSNPYEVFFGGNYPLLEIETSADNDKTLLLIKDSYANCFIPFILGDYKKILVMDPRYYAYNADMLFMTENITEVLFLYNAATLAQDVSLWHVLDNQ